MGQLPFPSDAELTGPDRIVLNVLRKEYESHDCVPDDASSELSQESGDSAIKVCKFVSPSPEGISCCSCCRALIYRSMGFKVPTQTDIF